MKDPFRRDRKLIEALLDLSEEALVIIDAGTGVILEAGAKACEMSGYSREELAGMNAEVIDRQACSEYSMREAAELRRVSVSRERELTRKDGSVFPAKVKTVISKSEDREVVVSAVKDLTKEKEALARAQRDRASLETLFVHSPDAIAVLDTSGRILEVNPAFCRLFCCGREEILGSGIADTIGGNGIGEEIAENLERILRDGYMEDETVRMARDGTQRHVSVRGVLVDLSEKARGLYAIYRDMTERHEAFRNLQRERVYWENLFYRSPLAIALVDNEDRIVRVNRRFEELFLYTCDEIAGCFLNDVVAPGHAHADAWEISRTVHDGVLAEFERKRLRKDGSWVDVAIMGLSFEVDGGRWAYAIYQDISDRKKVEEKILFLGYHDGLTGLFNQACLEVELDRMDRPEFLPLGIVMIDVDNLKLVNDAFGHLEGNRQLMRTAGLLREHCRGTDIYGRWGGDEFLLIMPECDQTCVQAVRDRLRQVFREGPGCATVPLSVSVGMAVKEDIRQGLADVRKQAEDDMYRDKLLSREGTRRALFDAVEKRLDGDAGRRPHIRRVCDLAGRFARHLGLDGEYTGLLELLARYHDIGNVGVPRELLERPGPLTEQEFRQLQRHAERGYHIARNLQGLGDIADEILRHHERYDGTGYPVGLSGKDIPFLSRAYALIDAYDAMTGYRVFRDPIAQQDALKEIESMAGSGFDPGLAASFVEMIRFSGDLS